MNNKTLIMLLLIVAPYCYSSNSPITSFTFEYNFKGEHFPVTISKANYDEALGDAADQCFNHFAKSKGEEKVSLPEELGIELIDECANPAKTTLSSNQ